MAAAIYNGNWVTYIEFIVEENMYALFDCYDNYIDKISHPEYLNQKQLHTIGNSYGRYRRTRPPLYSNPIRQSGGNTIYGTVIQTGTIPFAAAVTSTISNSEHGAIKDTGIRAGEVIARRCWRIRADRLFSIYMADYEWYPNYPATGNVAEGFGVHAFNNDYDLGIYIRDHACASYYLIPGTVSLWGEIVEHERGYRAEYAKILSLDIGDPWIKRKYGV